MFCVLCCWSVRYPRIEGRKSPPRSEHRWSKREGYFRAERKDETQNP